MTATKKLATAAATPITTTAAELHALLAEATRLHAAGAIKYPRQKDSERIARALLDAIADSIRPRHRKGEDVSPDVDVIEKIAALLPLGLGDQVRRTIRVYRVAH